MKEIEIRALLDKEKYEQIKKELEETYEKKNEDTITTVKFKPKDIRIRYSEKLQEIVFKDKDPTSLARKEITVNLQNKTDCFEMIKLLGEFGLEQDPSWKTIKQEFTHEYNGINYTLSLQHIENFAYILEAEILADQEDEEKHISNLKHILKNLKCEPIEPEEFKQKIKAYVTKYEKETFKK